MMVKLCSKIWLEHNGKIFGDGPCELLRNVERLGSLRKAAGKMNMSYAQAWELIRKMEENLGFPLLVTKVGGCYGGGSHLSGEGEKLLRQYTAFRKDIDEYLMTAYNKYFYNSDSIFKT